MHSENITNELKTIKELLKNTEKYNFNIDTEFVSQTIAKLDIKKVNYKSRVEPDDVINSFSTSEVSENDRSCYGVTDDIEEIIPKINNNEGNINDNLVTSDIKTDTMPIDLSITKI